MCSLARPVPLGISPWTRNTPTWSRPWPPSTLGNSRAASDSREQGTPDAERESRRPAGSRKTVSHESVLSGRRGSLGNPAVSARRGATTVGCSLGRGARAPRGEQSRRRWARSSRSQRSEPLAEKTSGGPWDHARHRGRGRGGLRVRGVLPPAPEFREAPDRVRRAVRPGGGVRRRLTAPAPGHRRTVRWLL